MAALYELAILGDPTDSQVQELEPLVSQVVSLFGLRLGHEVAWSVRPVSFAPDQKTASAAIFYGSSSIPQHQIDILEPLLKRSIPVLPIVSGGGSVATTIPPLLQRFNCLDYLQVGPQRIATALLECTGLLPRQRRVFLSYRRDEARQAALQLFDELSARHFDVFLDTHGIAPAEDFQEMLWHRLCDSDVLIMLDTPDYFSSRWTSAEFGRALAKNLPILCVRWPTSTPSPRTATASSVDIAVGELDAATGRLADNALSRVCYQLERERSKSHAVRNLNLVSNIRNAIQTLGGTVSGVGAHKAVYASLPNGMPVVIYPTVGIPTSTTLHNASNNAACDSIAVVYDPVGVNPEWLRHLDWLGQHIQCAKWVKATEVAWRFADWEA